MAKLLGGTRIYGNLIIDTNVAVNGTNVAISNTTGAIVAAGGIGLAGNIYAGGNIVLNSTGATVTQVWASANDSAAQPGYAWSGDTAAGMFQAAANTIGFTTVGVERARITNIGNLLVGTTATTLGSNSTVVISGLGTNGGGIELVGGGQSGGGNISALSGGGINFGTFTGAVGAEAYTERARFVPNGNLLIGTRVNPAGGNATVVIQGVGTNGGGAEFVGASGSGGGNISAMSGGGLTFSTFTGAVGSEVYTDRMRLNTTSNILINTALNPLGGNATVVVSGLGTNGGGIELVGGGQTGGGNISAMTAGGMTFGTFTGVVGAESYAERMRIEPTGNVGIGTTTSSNARVTIETANAGVSTGTIALMLQTRAGSVGTYVDLAAATYNGFTNTSPGTIRFIDDGNFSNNIAFRTKLGGAATNADVERMRIYSTGNIGIGTSTAPLGGNATVVIDGVGTNGGGIELVGGSTSGGANISGMSAGGLTISTFTGLVGAEVYTNRMIVNNAGNLLINTALNPLGGNATVVVGGIGTNGGGIELVGSTTGGGNISGMGNGGLTISTFTGAVGSEVYTNRMIVNNAGNLLINTVLNPLGGNATVVVGGIGTNGGGIELVGGGASGGGNISALAAGGLTVGTFTGAVGAESYAERMRIASDGNIGVNTATTTNAKFSIVGGTSSTLGELYLNAGTNWIRMGSSFAGGAYNSLVQVGDQALIFSGGTQTTTGALVIGPWTALTQVGLRMPAGGNLLIGTATSPLTSTAVQVINSTNGGGTEWVNNNSGGGNVSAISAGGLAFGTFTGAVGSEVVTERMRLAANGKFLVGTTIAPVGAATNLFLNASTGGGVQFGNNNTAGSNISVGFGNGIVFSSYTGVGGSETYTQRAMISGLTGNLLIGTATLPAGGNATVVVAGLGTNGGGIELVGSTTGGGNISGMGNGGLTFSTFTGAVGSEVYADRMRITALGNVGIGTATVGTGNTVAVFGGNIYVGSTNSGIVFPDGTYQSTAYGTSASGVTSFAAGTTGMTPTAATTGAVTLAFGTSATAQGIYSPTTNQIALSTASTARLLINANGNVLVGTTTAPAGSNATVVIASTGTNGGGIELVGSTTGGGNISAMTGGGLTVSTFTGAVGSEVYTNRMVVNNAGNLLINTALNPLGGNATVVIAGLGTNGGGAEYVGGGGSGGGNVSGLGNGGLVWSTFTGAVGSEVYAERMRLAAGGKLLVGATIAPVGAATNLFLNASTGGGVQFGNNNTSGSNISVGFGNGIVFSSYTGVGGSETYTQRAMISGLTGNLLVGTTALPAGGNATVVVAGLGTNGGGIELVGSTTGGGNISGMGNGGLTFSTFTGAVGSEVYADRMRITALGNIGIGTATVGTGNTVAVFGGNIYVGSTNSGIVFPDGTYQSTAYGTSTSGVTSFNASTTGMTPTTATTGAVTLAFGTSATAQGIYSPTTNQIALSTASTARLLINANGNVLVGTTTAPAGGTATLVLQGVGTNGGGIQFANVNAAGSNIGVGASNSMVFSTYTGAAGSEVYTERMRLISGGNILVGTATAPLGGNATVVVAGIGTNGGGIELVGSTTGGGNISGMGNGGLTFSTFTGAVGAEAYTERMRLSASGTFGIATAAPLSTLDVNGVISARTAFSTAGSAAVASVTSNGTVTGTAFVPSSATIPTNGIFLPAADTVGVAAGSTERMRVTTTGVGIGGAQQSSFNVTVNGGALGTVANSQVRMLNIYATDTNASSLEFTDVRNASGGADWTTAGMRMQQKIDATYMGWVGFNNGNTVTTNNGGISFGTGTSTSGPNGVPEVMRITSTGTVGIATVSPGSTLDVNGVISARTAFSTAGAATVASLTSNGSIGGTTATLSNATGPQITFTGATSQWIQWPTTATAAPTFTTSSVGTKLILYPNVSASTVDWALGIESNTMWFSTNNNTTGQFKWYGGTTQAMLLSGAGALTTTSTATSTAFIPSGATIPTNGMFLPAANTLGFATNSAEDMRLAPNGNLLVGLTTLPAGGNATVVLEGLGTNGGGIELIGGSASGGGLVSGLSAGGMAFATFTGAPGSEVYTERMRIDVNGNVGIATTTAPTGNIFAVYGRSFHAGNVQIANTTVGGAGIFFPDGTYQSTAATGSGGVSSFSGGTTGFTPSVLTTGAITLAGTLIAANGGTGFSTYVVGDLLYASTTTVLSRLAAVATGQVIVSAGAGTAPTYSGTPTLASLTLNTASGPQLTFSGATSNFINFGTVGDGAPAFTTRSAGTKAVYDSNITAISADYAVGVVNAAATAPLSTAPGTLWHSVPAANILHQFQWYGGTTVLATLWGNGNLAVTGEVTAYFSDSRLKDNVSIISDAVDKVKQIRGVYYHASDTAVELLGEDKTVQKVGLLAQEVEAVLPNVIRPAPFDVGSDGLSKSGENYLTLQYERVIPLLVQAIKEQQTQIEAQQVQIDSLLALITRLEPKP